MPSEDVPHVLIIGGGFAGLYAARTLKRAPVRVTLLDRENYHLFQPLLYQVATAALNPSDIAHPLRAALHRQSNVTVLLGEATAIEPEVQRVLLANGSVRYDALVMATGATHSYFGHDNWSVYAPGLKTVQDALEIRRRIYLAYEAAEREDDQARRKAWLTFVVVGAGPTGVELAGALAEIGRHTLAKEFRRIDPKQVRVVLIEGEERVLPVYPERLSAKARRHLEKMGVEVRTGARAAEIDAEGVVIETAPSEERLRARTVLWAAGVAASPLARTLGARLDDAGRVRVDPDLSVPGHPEIFVAGDLAHVPWRDDIVPGVAPAAIQMGKRAARNVIARLAGHETSAFAYADRGSLATIGRAAAVADFGRVRFGGWLAWMAWLVIHILFLVGFRNRLWVISGWAWSYITDQRGARLITGLRNDEDLPRLHR